MGQLEREPEGVGVRRVFSECSSLLRTHGGHGVVPYVGEGVSRVFGDSGQEYPLKPSITRVRWTLEVFVHGAEVVSVTPC